MARPIDPYHDLAKGLEAYPAKAIDDDGEGDGEPVAIEAVVDPDPTGPGSA